MLARFLSYRAMATNRLPLVPIEDETRDVASQQTPWRKRIHLSSVADTCDAFLAASGFDRGPWLAVGLAAGIALWFALDGPFAWLLALSGCVITGLGAVALWKGEDGRVHLVHAAIGLSVAVALGLGLIWARSLAVGVPAIERPLVGTFDARVLDRIDQPAEQRVRLVLATRDPQNAAPIRVRVNLPLERDQEGLREGAVIRLQARLMPPAPPMLPGGYNFARAAWFQGLSATGSVLGDVRVLETVEEGSFIGGLQRGLSGHVRQQLGGAPASIAAALASGDRGAISEADEIAMRDAGLTHLLSISGLHVSALIAAAAFSSTFAL